ncbi:MAG: hypothetical protein ACTHKL_08195, partial [Streptosporangiaceae bacterium]
MSGSGQPDSQEIAALKGLLLSSLQAMQPVSEAEILEQTANAVAAIAGCQTTGVLFDRAWQDVGNGGDGLLPADVVRCGTRTDGGPIVQHGVAWSWVYPMGVGRDAAGYLVIGARAEPAVSDQALLQAIGRHAGAAL